MRRPLRAAAILVAPVLAGCETSQVDPSASVVVTGRVLLADGSPAAGARLGLAREPSAGDFLGSLFIVPLSFFTACLADPPPALCRGRSIRRTTTAAGGICAFHLKGKAVAASRHLLCGADHLGPAGGHDQVRRRG